MNIASGKTLLLSAAVILAADLALKNDQNSCRSGSCFPLDLSLSAAAAEAAKPAATNAAAKTALPRLVDLGADKCIPCKMMAPILKDLKKEYDGAMQVDFIDVWKNPDAGKAYNINLIPTQIFFDASGKELFRHEGFLSKEDILAKWKELGVSLKSPAKPQAGREKTGKK